MCIIIIHGWWFHQNHSLISLLILYIGVSKLKANIGIRLIIIFIPTDSNIRVLDLILQMFSRDVYKSIGYYQISRYNLDSSQSENKFSKVLKLILVFQQRSVINVIINLNISYGIHTTYKI